MVKNQGQLGLSLIWEVLLCVPCQPEAQLGDFTVALSQVLLFPVRTAGPVPLLTEGLQAVNTVSERILDTNLLSVPTRRLVIVYLTASSPK